MCVLTPGVAWAAVTAVVDSLSASPSTVDPVSGAVSVPASAPVAVTCAATAVATSSPAVTQMAVAVTAGLLPSGGQSQTLSIAPGPSATGTVVWTTPPAGASATVTCQVTASGCDSFGCRTSTATRELAVSTADVPAVLLGAIQGPSAPVLVGTQVQLSVAPASDPQGGLLTYTWSATGGTIAGAGTSASWTAPQTAGTYTVSLLVSSSSGSAPALAVRPVEAALTFPQGALPAGMSGPSRVAAAPDGRLAVADGRGSLWLLTPRGEALGRVELSRPALAVAWGPEVVFVSTHDAVLLTVDPAAARVTSSLDLGLARGPTGLAWEPGRQLLWMAEPGAEQVRALRLDGSTAAVITTCLPGGASRLISPADVALDARAGLLWTVLAAASGGYLAHAYTLDGAWVSGAVAVGSAAGQVNSPGGVAVDAQGRLYVSDSFLGRVQVVTAAGLPAGTVGSYGTGAGELRGPAGLAVRPGGDLVVANGDNGRLERFAATPDLPECRAGGQPDSDCDGMPDWWERLHGLDPLRAGDALLDIDGDGLTNLQELLYGTDPRRWDTDGDGVSDGEEIAAGQNPLDPRDNRPILVASGPPATDPGLVRVNASVAKGVGGCSASWRQVAGPSATLRGAATLSPSFVARAAGTYRLEGSVSCGNGQSDPVWVEAVVRDVAPRPDPGRLAVVNAGSSVVLDGSFSADANGDLLSLAWDQTLGPPAAAPTAGSQLVFTAGEGGLFSFALTATDGAGLSAAAEVPVLVLRPGSPVPTAVAATPVASQAGGRVLLDARPSLGAEGATFAWTQVAGAPVVLDRPGSALASFVAPAAGRYRFEVAVSRGELRSPPAAVEVFAAEAGAGLPAAAATAPSVVEVGQPAELDGSGSRAAAGGSLTYAWRQVSGPAAGLTDADRSLATVVPFAAGTYVFELAVSEGQAVGLPVRVSVDADLPGQARPVAVARGLAGAPRAAGSVGHGPLEDARRALGRRRVVLNGAASKGAAHYRWTQVGGPWVAPDDPAAAVTGFSPPGPGTYAFELEVDDGAVRSAPARVAVPVRP